MRQRYSPGDVCSVDGCDRYPESRGMCASHRRAAKLGREIKPFVRYTTEQRFWQKVDRENGPLPDPLIYGEIGRCWSWLGYRSRHGYGQLGLGRRKDGTMLAHRYSWQLVNGEIPDGMSVRHACDHPPCVNPAHLLIGSPADNAADAVSRGRNKGLLPGEKHPGAILTEEQVRAIRAERASRGTTYPLLADRYGVSPAAIVAIVHRRSWKHVV